MTLLDYSKGVKNLTKIVEEDEKLDQLMEDQTTAAAATPVVVDGAEPALAPDQQLLKTLV